MTLDLGYARARLVSMLNLTGKGTSRSRMIYGVGEEVVQLQSTEVLPTGLA